jgi:hypothetical protein
VKQPENRDSYDKNAVKIKSLLTEALIAPTAPAPDEEYGASLGRIKSGRGKLKFHKNDMPQYYYHYYYYYYWWGGTESLGICSSP